jgi:hypothetical protein
MTTKLTEKKRDDAKALLEDHQAVTDAIFNLKKAAWFANMSVANNEDDFIDVRFNHKIAMKALAEQKAWVEAELAKLEIEIA